MGDTGKPMGAAQRITSLERSLASLREEYNQLKVASAKRNARDRKVSNVVNNIAALMDFLSALETKLPNAQQALLAVANGHELPQDALFDSAEQLGKFAVRARRLAAELTGDGGEV